MNTSPLISIIVPVYNVALYVEKCITSILNQDISSLNYELIIVNDGTPDNSMELIYNIIKGKNNVIVINKSNGGLSSARNTGLSIAKGNYIWFIDSDDYIEEHSLEKIIAEIDKTNETIYLLSTNLIKDNKTTKILRNMNTNSFGGIDVYRDDYKYPFSAVQFYIYQHDFLKANNMTFKEGIIYEDILFTAQVLSHNPQCRIINGISYNYVIREDSITQSVITRKNIRSCMIVCDELNAYSNRVSDQGRYVLLHSVSILMNILFMFYYRLSMPDRNYLLIEFKKRIYWSKSTKCASSVKALISYISLNVLASWHSVFVSLKKISCGEINKN